MKKVPYFNDVTKSFLGFVGDLSPVRIYLFELELRKALRDAYKQGYKKHQQEIDKKQDIYDNAG